MLCKVTIHSRDLALAFSVYKLRLCLCDSLWLEISLHGLICAVTYQPVLMTSSTSSSTRDKLGFSCLINSC